MKHLHRSLSRKLSLWLGSLLVVCLLLSGCTPQTNTTSPSVEKEPTLLKGVSLSPRSFTTADFQDFFVKASEAGNTVTWAGDWLELAKENSGAATLMSLADQYDYTPVVIVSFYSNQNGKAILTRPFSAENKQAYREATLNFVREYKPKYLCLGIEVNIVYETDPALYQEFVDLYTEIYRTVKQESPETNVFSMFQLERMKGLQGGLFGGRNDPSLAQWHLLESFPQQDLIAFSTYPMLIYASPTEIPDDYYLGIREHSTLPVAFLESGWSRVGVAGGWESSAAEQVEFVEHFDNLLDGVELKIVIWSFLYDPPIGDPFKGIGLLSKEQDISETYLAWVNAFQSSE